MAEDQVVVGDEVEEPDVQLLRIVTLRNKANKYLQRLQAQLKVGSQTGLTLARRSRRTTLMPVEASSRLGML